MKRSGLFSLLFLGMMSSWGGLCSVVRAQALPAGQEAENEVVKKPPFGGLGFEVSMWDQSGVWAGGGAYRNDLGFLLLPTWNIGRRFISKGPFRTLTLQARFAFEVPLAGFDAPFFTGDAPSAGSQTPCSDGTTRCPYAGGPRRVDYSDLSLNLGNPRIYIIPRTGIHIDTLFSLTLPTSAQSQLATLVMQGLLQVGAGREFWKDRISIGFSEGFGKGFYQYATGRVVANNPGDAPLTYSQDVLSGTGLANFYEQPGRQVVLCDSGTCRAPTFFLQHSFRASINILTQLSATVLYRISSSYVGCDGPCVPGSDLTSIWRDGQLLWTVLNYEPLPWLAVNLSYIVAAPFWQFAKSVSTDPSSSAVGNGQSTRSYRQALYSADANDFSSISLGVTFVTESLLAKVLRKQ